MDELSVATKVDPLEFRLSEVLLAAADRAGWESRPPPNVKQEVRADGRGLAFARYENNQAIVACTAFVVVDRDIGSTRVTKVVVAHVPGKSNMFTACLLIGSKIYLPAEEHFKISLCKRRDTKCQLLGETKEH